MQVPGFVGISSAEIKSGLRNVGFDLDREWAGVVTTVSETEQAAVLATKKFPEVFWAAQRLFLERFDSAFGRARERFLDLSESQRSAIDSILSQARVDKLMVRSSGKEDTRLMANAGSNESIANVEATIEAICAAAHRVVRSYFSEKSLMQRLGLGD